MEILLLKDVAESNVPSSEETFEVFHPDKS